MSERGKGRFRKVPTNGGRPVGAKTKNPNAKKTGPRGFTLTERERLKNEAQQLDLQGYSSYQIGEKLGVSKGTAYGLLAEIQDDYQKAYVDNRKAMVMRATAAHLDVIRQAQEQIAKLRANGKTKNVVKRYDKMVKDEEGNWSVEPVEETTDSREDGEIGGYLGIITDNWKQIGLLHGLHDLPKQIFNVQVNNNTVNVFEQVLQAVLGNPDGLQLQADEHSSPTTETNPIVCGAVVDRSRPDDTGTDELPLSPPTELLHANDPDQEKPADADAGSEPQEPPSDV